MEVKMKINIISMIALITLITVLLFISGCTEEQKTMENKNSPDNQTRQFTKNVQKTFIPTPSSPGTTPSRSGNQLYLEDIQDFLTDWNEWMDWGFSAQQIADFNRSLTSGILKKYQINSGYKKDTIAWDIPDMKLFCLELGNEIGLSKDQSEIFATNADDYYARGKISFEGGVPTKHFFSMDNCSVTIERGKQKQINLTYTLKADVTPTIVRFNSTQTPLTLAFYPSELTVKPFHKYQAVIIINTSPSLEPGRYQFRPSIEGKDWADMYCMDSDPYTGVNQNIIYVTVV
jgi:hypothetical protein